MASFCVPGYPSGLPMVHPGLLDRDSERTVSFQWLGSPPYAPTDKDFLGSCRKARGTYKITRCPIEGKWLSYRFFC